MTRNLTLAALAAGLFAAAPALAQDKGAKIKGPKERC
jgi:hypothetical protein